jgi:hypothetical protein
MVHVLVILKAALKEERGLAYIASENSKLMHQNQTSLLPGISIGMYNQMTYYIAIEYLMTGQFSEFCLTAINLMHTGSHSYITWDINRRSVL